MAKLAFQGLAQPSLPGCKARAAMSRGGASIRLWMLRVPHWAQPDSAALDDCAGAGVLEMGHQARTQVFWPSFPAADALVRRESAPRHRVLGHWSARRSEHPQRTLRRFSMKSQLETRGLESPTKGDAQVSSAKRVRKVLHLNDPETYARLQRMVRKVCPSWLERERDDFAQKAMMRLLERAKKLGEEGEQGLCASYLYRTAHSTVVDEIRKRKREVLAEDIEDYRADVGHVKHEELRSSESPLGNASSKALREAIQACLSQIAPERSRAVSLRLEGFKISEIAEMMDWKKKRAENLERRGRENLRDCLKGKGYEVQC